MSRTRKLYAIEAMPVFQNRMHTSREDARACARGDVTLVEDLGTGLIYNHDFDPSVMVYDENYQNEQAVSPLFQAHLDTVARLVEREMGRRSLLEIGCGKGRFLEMLAAQGCEIGGIDPTYEGDNPHIIKDYFSEARGIKADGIVLRHVLEHIQDPYAFLKQIAAANGNRGKIYIEVPCFDWITEHRSWFDIFYEHVNYFRLTDFHRMFGTLHAAGRFFGDQYLYVVADLATLRTPVYSAADSPSIPEDFLATRPHRQSVAAGQRVIWGGASKGVIFALMSERAGAPVEAVIDINPAKQGRYLPATGLKVHAPHEVLPRLSPGSTIYVMNSNYLPEIAGMSGNAFTYVGVDRVEQN